MRRLNAHLEVISATVVIGRGTSGSVYVTEKMIAGITARPHSPVLSQEGSWHQSIK